MVRGAVNPSLRAAGHHLARSPGWQLVVGGAVLALAFPGRLAGTVGAAILAAGCGIAALLAWPRLPGWLRRPPADVTSTLVVALVIACGLSTFWDTLTVSPDWQLGDWGPQHAVLARALHALPGLDLPVWNHVVSTGDAPFELYPKLAYLVTGHTALALGMEQDLPRAMMVVAVATHLAIAVGTAAIARRIAPWPLALLVGIAALVDSGAVAHGGTVGLFRWALLHSALALACSTAAAVAIVATLTRPRLRSAIAIWVATALACATHPAGLLAAAASAVALAAVALLASDVPPRRALIALGHVVLGVALGALAWMPLAERILAYGQHYPNALRSPGALLEDLLQSPSPVTAFALLGYAGYAGIVAGLWSRRAPIIFVAASALVLLVGLCDLPYLALDLAPGQGIARLGTERLAQLARPFVAAAGAYAIALAVAQIARGWQAAPPARRWIAAGVAGVLTAALLGALPPVWRAATNRAYSTSQVIAEDPAGRAQLVAWAQARVAAQQPEAWGRAVFETDTHEHFHLTALTGLPTFHLPPQPDLLLRERIEDLSPASLRRFNVRWAIAQDRAPTLGDPATEVSLGTFRIREIAAWDGQFARIERGTGSVRTTRLDDGAVDIEVTASEPVLVALGTGYYPRWRARHADGREAPVYALPGIVGGSLHVVAAWVAPGRTRFTCDGPLPSDGRGTWISALALLAALAGVVVWSRRRWRWRVLRRIAGLRRRWRGRGPRVVAIAVPLAVVALLVRGCSDAHGPARALELGSGLRGTAEVSARLRDGAWQACGYERATGAYVCDQLVIAYDGIASLLNDAPPSWAFNTPGIVASAHRTGVELRVRLRARLSGRYWMAVSSGTVVLEVSGEATRVIDRAVVPYADAGERTIELRADVPTTYWAFTGVRESTLVPPRPFLAGPPLAPPAAAVRGTLGR